MAAKLASVSASRVSGGLIEQEHAGSWRVRLPGQPCASPPELVGDAVFVAGEPEQVEVWRARSRAVGGPFAGRT